MQSSNSTLDSHVVQDLDHACRGTLLVPRYEFDSAIIPLNTRPFFGALSSA